MQFWVLFSCLFSGDGQTLIDNTAQVGCQDARAFFLINGGDILEIISNLGEFFCKILIDDLFIDAWLNPFLNLRQNSEECCKNMLLTLQPGIR